MNWQAVVVLVLAGVVPIGLWPRPKVHAGAAPAPDVVALIEESEVHAHDELPIGPPEVAATVSATTTTTSTTGPPSGMGPTKWTGELWSPPGFDCDCPTNVLQYGDQKD